MNRTPEEAKKLVAGPLGRQMEMFPLRFCKPASFGVPPSREHPVLVNNGTASLLDLRGDLLDANLNLRPSRHGPDFLIQHEGRNIWIEVNAQNPQGCLRIGCKAIPV